MRARVRIGLVIAATAVALSGCASISDDALQSSLTALDAASSPAGVPPATPPANTPCRKDPTASLRPRGTMPRPGRMPAGTFMRAIQTRGRLIVGVDQTTLLFGYFNPLSGGIEGFEIDVLRQVAAAIFGTPGAIYFRAISSAERESVIRDGSVDIVANLMSITCARSKLVAFTTVYYEAAQRVLVPKTSTARSIADLTGRRVCATRGSTSIDFLKAETAVRPYPVPLRTDCLVALQEGRVAAISTDDAILYGFRAQDPQTKIVGGRLKKEPWGMAINKGHPEFVRFVNGVLARIRRDGTWASIYERSIGRVTREPAPAPPRARYRD